MISVGQKRQPGWRSVRWPLILGVLALALRLAYFQLVIGGSSPLQGDEGVYHGIAVSYLNGQGWRDPVSGHQSERSPLLSAWLVVLYGAAGVNLSLARYTMLIGSALMVVALYAVVKLATRGREDVAVSAALLLAVYPPAWHWSWQVMTETPTALLALLGVAAFYLGARRGSPAWAAATGCLWGGLALCRLNYLPLLPAMWLGQQLLTRLTPLDVRWTGRQWGLSALVWLATLAPWVAHNYAAQGRFVPATTQLGQMMMICNGTLDHPFVQDGLYYKNPELTARMAQAESELAWNAMGMAIGSAEIRANWRLLPHAVLMRALNFWVQRPQAMDPGWSPSDLIMLVIWLPLLGLSIYSYRLWSWRHDWLAALIVLCVFGTILPFWGGPRFRFPVDALIIGRAAIPLASLMPWLRARYGLPGWRNGPRLETAAGAGSIGAA